MSREPMIRALIYERDGYRCCRCGTFATSIQHRIHGNRSDMRSSNLIAACGDGTRGCHGWMEHNRNAARAKGWEVSRHGPRAATQAAPVFLANHPLAPAPDGGWFLLDDDYGLRPCNEHGEEASDGVEAGT